MIWSQGEMSCSWCSGTFWWRWENTGEMISHTLHSNSPFYFKHPICQLKTEVFQGQIYTWMCVVSSHLHAAQLCARCLYTKSKNPLENSFLLSSLSLHLCIFLPFSWSLSFFKSLSSLCLILILHFCLSYIQISWIPEERIQSVVEELYNTYIKKLAFICSRLVSLSPGCSPRPCAQS